MSGHYSYLGFGEELVDQLPSFGSLGTRSDEFWNQLGVNAPRIINDINSPDYFQSSLSLLGVGGLRPLCLWLGEDPHQGKDDLIDSIKDVCGPETGAQGGQTIALINEFLKGKRYDAVENFSRILLSDGIFNLIHSSGIDSSSKRFFYGLWSFIDNPYNLLILMFFESAERAGYKRFTLVPRFEDSSGSTLDEETAEEASRVINRGIEQGILNVGFVNDVLEKYERRQGEKESLCYEVFEDQTIQSTQLFILRFFREAHIRELDEVVFGEEAEEVVLRFSNDLRTLEEHSTSGVGLDIAEAIAKDVFDNQHIKYLQATQMTAQEDLDEFINVLVRDNDVNLRLREIYLKTAPIDGSPQLIIRCEKDNTLSAPIRFLEQQDISLLDDFQNIRSIKVAFGLQNNNDDQNMYSFTIYWKTLRSQDYFLPYSSPPIPTKLRVQFEEYLKEEHNVRIVPGTR